MCRFKFMPKMQSKIEKLIAELCPKGVEFKELGAVCKIETGKLNANAAVDDGKYMFFTTAKEPSKIDRYRWDTEALLIAGNANVGEIKHYIGKFEAYQRTYVLTNFSKDVDVRFLFFSLSDNFKKYLENHTNSAAMTYIVLSTLENFKIPVPPLAVQEEIVKILDNFTALEAELEAELEARKKQYEYYRDNLLSIENVEYKTLGEVGELIRGNGLQKKDFTETGVGCIHYGQIYTYYGTFANKTKSFVSKELAKSLKKANNGDLVITSTSENIEDVCKAVAWLGDDEIVTGGHATIFKHHENPKYLSYYFQTQNFSDQKKKYAKGTKVIDVSAKDLAKIKIPVPLLAEQNRIVSILDKFDALVNDISIGLPAELKARRQQYEYYRGKLLTFNEVG